MKIKHINWELGTITIPSTISKNGKTQSVVIPFQFFAEIEHLKTYPIERHIIESVRGGMVKADFFNKEHKKVLTALKLNGNYSFYSWKHTGAVKCIKNGVGVKDLQMQLRHHSLDMVNEYLKDLGVLDSTCLSNNYPSI